MNNINELLYWNNNAYGKWKCRLTFIKVLWFIIVLPIGTSWLSAFVSFIPKKIKNYELVRF